MNKATRILTRHGLAYALCSTQLPTARAIQKRVSHLAHFSTPLPIKNHSLINLSFYAQRLFFSSKPESSLEILSSHDCPDNKSENELKDSKLKLNHESVVYELKKLSKDPMNASKFLKWAVEREGFEPNSSIYSLILRILASKEFLKEFWVTINEMKEKGHYLDEETYRTICSTFRGLKMENEATNLRHFYKRLIQENAMEDRVTEVVDVIKSSGWGRKVESKLEEMKIEASDDLMLRVFKELRGKGSTLKAYNFFKWVERSLGFKHNGVTYNGMLRVLCWEESILKFWEVLEEMKDSGSQVDIDTYVKVSRQLLKNKMVEDSVKLYEHMMDSSFKPSERECNLLLRSIASDKPDVDLVRRVVNKYESSGNPFTKQLYDRIHRSLTSVGEFDGAEKIVEKMKNDGYEPDNITYSQTVFGYCKERRFDEAAEVLDMMEEQGCKPEIKTWTILIKGYCAANEMEKALLCFTKMSEKGFDADAELLHAYELLVELVQREGLRPWQEMYKNLIEKLLDYRKIEEATELLRMMKDQNYPPFEEPFVRCISKSGSVEDAWKFLIALGGKEQPTVSAYQHVFQTFIDEGRHSEAKDLLVKCPKLIRKHPSISTIFGSAT